MDALLHVHGVRTGLEVLADLVLVARLRVQHVPLAGAVVRTDRLRRRRLVEELGLAQGLADLGIARWGVGGLGVAAGLGERRLAQYIGGVSRRLAGRLGGVGLVGGGFGGIVSEAHVSLRGRGTPRDPRRNWWPVGTGIA